MRVGIDTHGCRLNQAESDAIAAALQARGHALVGEPEQADCWVLNTCTITHEADADARAAIRRAKRRNPELAIVVTGCHATAAPEQLAALPEVDAVIGNLDKQRLDPLLEAIARPRSTPGGFVAVERLHRRERPPLWQLEPAIAPERTRPLLKVQDGCDLQCSFCIVPSVRGRSRSLPLDRAVEQLATLDHHAEVVLTGAHLGSWGRDRSLGRGSRLGTLVSSLLAARPHARLRLGSVDPHEVEPDLIALLGRGIDPTTGAGLCPHVHLPVQSGDDAILRAMRRAHDVEDLDRLVPALRTAAPDLAIGTDVIVGFPGERDDAFERTLALFERHAIPFAHVFVWSPREGTPASELHDRVAPEIANKRSKVLRDRVASNLREFLSAQVGRERSAIIQRRRDRRTGNLIALTDNAIELQLQGPDLLLGKRTRLRLEGVDQRGPGGRLA